MFISDLPKADKLELYKQLKGYFLFENNGKFDINDLSPIMDEKVKDIRNILFFEISIDCMEWYRIYTYGGC